MPQHYLDPADATDPHRLPNVLTSHYDSDPNADAQVAQLFARYAYAGVRFRLAGRIADAVEDEANAERCARMLERNGADTLREAIEEQARERAEDDHRDGRDARDIASRARDIIEALDLPGAGWWYAIAFPGCMPDSDWTGPYATEAAAVEAARDTHGD